MSPLLTLAVTLVVLALTFYTVGVVAQQRAVRVTRKVLSWLVAGVAFDVSATTCMILASGRILTLHGVIGYSALMAMLVDTSLAFRHRRRHGDAEVPRWLHLYTRGAYAWWVVAFITGGLLVVASRAG